ncbi:hypothetical protein J2Z60_001034 [Lactobacillus colini]|uniref:Hydrogenase n=1 Tax=Lactobacillus colini TaxID=1819254 RepID=A0ABS4MDV4_9LACO|nr:DUF3737 family protein [Lactobacillus colini]MBP2057862.1 hypothetical protein [Lactobacillus colini]
MRKVIRDKYFEGERSLYGIEDAVLDSITFGYGESPLKETSGLDIKNTIFTYKYPLWYSNQINVVNSTFETMSRSGIWYTNDISIKNSNLQAPKLFRRCSKIELDHVFFSNAEETMWSCNQIKITNSQVNGDYFGKDSSDIYLENVDIIGNYVFDGANNIECHNCHFVSKDAFWNCENVKLVNCSLDGEYLAWNTNHIEFINCSIKSDQGLCYINDLKLENCQLLHTGLAFEKCSKIKAEITNEVDSIKNPISGKIHAHRIKTIIIDPEKVDPQATQIISDLPVFERIDHSDTNQEAK